MNRFRVGLHIAGNVVISCKRCNSEKRRDDSRVVLDLATSGWESFLSHDGSRCASGCNTCSYWQAVWPDSEIRSLKLSAARTRISAFRARFPEAMSRCERAHRDLKANLDSLYREGQQFAADKINSTVAAALKQMLD